MTTAASPSEFPARSREREFERLYHRYANDVYRYALALLRNPADAEDVTQTTFMNAYRAYKRGERPLKPQNWLITIAHNAARTRHARMSRRAREVPLEDHVERLAATEEERPDVAGVLAALAQLPFNQRAALVMRELEGRSYAEIAETLSVSVSAVEALVFRGRRSLKLHVSQLRVLGGLPLPASLVKLFGGGGAVAGGAGVGASFSSGLVLTAAVVIAAGAVATGIGGDRTGGAPASSHPHVATPTLAASHAFATRAPIGRAGAERRSATRRAARGSIPHGGSASAAEPRTQSSPRAEVPKQPTHSTPSTDPVGAVVTEQETKAADAVQNVVDAAQSTVPALPSPPPAPLVAPEPTVTAPQLPSLPPVDVSPPPLPIPAVP